MGALRAGRLGGGADAFAAALDGRPRRPGRARRPRPVALVARPARRGDRPPPRGVRGVPPPRRRRAGGPVARTWRASAGSTASTRRPRVARPRAPAARRCRHRPELGWLEIEEAKRAADPVVAEQHARAALDVAHALSDPDVECMALAQLGRALVRQGRVDEGVTLLDEAMTVALGGETSDPLACGDACCTTLVVCDEPRRPASSRGVVRGRRRVHRAAALHPRPVVVSRDLRRGPRPRRGLGARRRRPRRGARPPARPQQAGEDGRCRSPCSPVFVCGRAGWRTPRCSSTGSTTSPPPSRRSCELSARARRPRVRAGVARPAAGRRRGWAARRSAGRSRSRPATSTRRDRPRETLHDVAAVGRRERPRRRGSPPRRARGRGRRRPRRSRGRARGRRRPLLDAALPARGRPSAARARASPGDKRLSTRALDGARCARLLRGARRPSGRRPGRSPAPGARRLGPHRRPAASATSSRRASARSWVSSRPACRTPRSRSGS